MTWTGRLLTYFLTYLLTHCTRRKSDAQWWPAGLSLICFHNKQHTSFDARSTSSIWKGLYIFILHQSISNKVIANRMSPQELYNRLVNQPPRSLLQLALLEWRVVYIYLTTATLAAHGYRFNYLSLTIGGRLILLRCTISMTSPDTTRKKSSGQF